MLPLENITVLDLTSMLAGPMATHLLSEQGAKVIKVEPPSGDRQRQLGCVPMAGHSSGFAAVNANKLSISLDLALEADRQQLAELVRTADMLVHNCRPDGCAKLGLDAENLHRLNPQLVIGHLTGFGNSGPYAGMRAYDPIFQAESALAVMGEHGPALAPQWLCDKTSGLYFSQSLTSALLASKLQGKGVLVELSMLEAAVHFGWVDIHATSVFPDSDAMPPNIALVYKPWRTANGWMILVVLSEAEFTGFANALEMPELLDDERFGGMMKRFSHWQELRDLCKEKLASLTSEEVKARLDAAGVPCGIARTPETLLEHPQLAHDGFIRMVDHPEIGRVRQPLPASKFNGQRAEPGAVPAIGQHGQEICGSVSA